MHAIFCRRSVAEYVRVSFESELAGKFKHKTVQEYVKYLRNVQLFVLNLRKYFEFANCFVPYPQVLSGPNFVEHSGTWLYSLCCQIDSIIFVYTFLAPSSPRLARYKNFIKNFTPKPFSDPFLLPSQAQTLAWLVVFQIDIFIKYTRTFRRHTALQGRWKNQIKKISLCQNFYACLEFCNTSTRLQPCHAPPPPPATTSFPSLCVG